MKDRFKEDVAVDVQDVLSRFTLDTATEFLFGQDVKTLSADLPYPSTYRGPNRRREHPSDRFALAITRAMEYTFPRVIYGEFWRLMDFWEDTVATQMEITHEFIDPIIHAALERRKVAKELDEVQDEGTLLDHLVKQTDGGNQSIQRSVSNSIQPTDFNVIRDEVFNIMVAGRDTVRIIQINCLMCTSYPNATRPPL